MVSERFEQGRNFANKLWNAARFCLMNLEDCSGELLESGQAFAEEERWILSRVALTSSRVADQLQQFRFSDYAKALYDFTWSEFCDWYVEMAKIRLRDPVTRPAAQRVLAAVLDALVRLLHPIMPFLTEQIWQALGEVARSRGFASAGGIRTKASEPSVMVARWPEIDASWRDFAVESRMDRLQDVIRAVRNIRSNFNVDQRARVAVHVRCSDTLGSELNTARLFIEQLASVDTLIVGPQVVKRAESASAVGTDWELYVPLTGLIDRAAEIERNRKQLQSVESQLKSYQSKLNNADFISKAPRDVVEFHQQRVAELQAQKATIEEILQALGATSK
jgi:valyl-tRNA synthetase